METPDIIAIFSAATLLIIAVVTLIKPTSYEE
jgi:hypothetical protein